VKGGGLTPIVTIHRRVGLPSPPRGEGIVLTSFLCDSKTGLHVKRSPVLDLNLNKGRIIQSISCQEES